MQPTKSRNRRPRIVDDELPKYCGFPDELSTRLAKSPTKGLVSRSLSSSVWRGVSSFEEKFSGEEWGGDVAVAEVSEAPTSILVGGDRTC